MDSIVINNSSLIFRAKRVTWDETILNGKVYDLYDLKFLILLNLISTFRILSKFKNDGVRLVSCRLKCLNFKIR